MVSLNIKADIKDATRYLTRVQKKQIPFATALALTKTAQEVKKGLINEIKQSFDRPTRFTLNSLYVKPAKKRDLEAFVKVKDESLKAIPAAKWLAAQIHGGARHAKGSEVLLRRRGILGPNEYMVPGRGVRLNRFGNVTRGQIQKILSNLGAQRDKYQNTTNKSKKAYFVGTINGQRGIWERRAKGVRPAFIFVNRPHYRKRFKFFKVAHKIISRRFRKNFDRALRRALSTAF